MSASNSWAEFADLFRNTRHAFLDHERAKGELKVLMPEDAKEAPSALGRRSRRWASTGQRFNGCWRSYRSNRVCFCSFLAMSLTVCREVALADCEPKFPANRENNREISSPNFDGGLLRHSIASIHSL
jgi:hypothetical protein